jgi:alkyldihydroxyacetonephosphate synthase
MIVRMRRWNGWGDDAIDVVLSDRALAELARQLGPGVVTPDAPLDRAVQALPRPRIEHAGASSSAEIRLLHARGQSLPDWIALRAGRIGAAPDAVAFPTRDAEVLELLAWAGRERCAVIPYGGGTSVAGHLTPPADRPSLTISLARLRKLRDVDQGSRLASFEAGVAGPDLEAQLAPHGLRLGHYPQSFEYSTLGGWVATRSCGQQSRGYGRIEDVFAGGSLATPRGSIELPAFPATAAGPDLRQLVLGSEGRLGIITRVVVRVRELPAHESFHAVLFRDWESGVEAAKAIVRDDVELSMLRLSDADETRLHSIVSGGAQSGTTKSVLKVLGFTRGPCVLMMGVSTTAVRAKLSLARAYELAARHSGLPLGAGPGERWRHSRFKSAYLRNSLWDAGYAADTMETAVPWSKLTTAALRIKQAAAAALQSRGERVLCFLHVSHVYPDGGSLYATCLFRRTADPDELLERWQAIKSATSDAIVDAGGTISHQHGVGVDHLPYLEREKSRFGVELLQAMARQADPDGILNPGKLIPD